MKNEVERYPGQIRELSEELKQQEEIILRLTTALGSKQKEIERLQKGWESLEWESKQEIERLRAKVDKYKRWHYDNRQENERLRAALERKDKFIAHLLGECEPNCKDCGE